MQYFNGMRADVYLFKIGLEREGYFQRGYLSQMLLSYSLKEDLWPLQVELHAVGFLGRAKKRIEQDCGERNWRSLPIEIKQGYQEVRP